MQVFTRVPKLEDFDRVHFYASRIRSLEQWSSASSAADDVDVVTYSLLLTQRFHIGPLLPNLKHVDLCLDDFCGQSVYPRLVMSPKLRSIRLKGHTDMYFAELPEEDWNNVVAVLAPCLPSLHKFKVVKGMDAYESYEEYLGLSSTKILCCSFQSIESLKIPLLNPSLEALTHLAKLPALRQLEFAIKAESLSAFNHTTPLRGDFNRLQSLVIHADGISGCVGFLSRQAFPHLRDLSIVDNGSGLIQEIDSLVEHMKTPCLQALRLLRCPNVDLWGFQGIPSPQLVGFTRSTLTSLLRITTLKHLEITLNLEVRLTNEDLKNICTAWPLLNYLSLADNRLNVTPGMTFEGLFPLVKKCHDLKTLIIRVNAESIPKFYSNAGGLRPANQLTHLGFCTSPLLQSKDIVEFIPLLFPFLETLDVSEVYKHASNDGNDLPGAREKICRKAWIEVVDSLKPLVPSYGVRFRGRVIDTA
ncbi:hypothetical protein H0H93_004185 [Arthromyces matolae]|nr:hypothetical protein H0H93_004185 [Arthromyces matolae]